MLLRRASTALAALLAHPAGTGLASDDLVALLRWRTPRRADRLAAQQHAGAAHAQQRRPEGLRPEVGAAGGLRRGHVDQQCGQAAAVHGEEP